MDIIYLDRKSRIKGNTRNINLSAYNPSYLFYNYLHNIPKINRLSAIWEGYPGITLNITLQKSMRFESLMM